MSGRPVNPIEFPEPGHLAFGMRLQVIFKGGFPVITILKFRDSILSLDLVLLGRKNGRLKSNFFQILKGLT